MCAFSVCHLVLCYYSFISASRVIASLQNISYCEFPMSLVIGNKTESMLQLLDNAQAELALKMFVSILCV